jgi:aconitate hydratase
MDVDLYNEPLSHDKNGQPVYLRDIWPSTEEIRQTVASAVKTEMFRQEYEQALTGDEGWNTLAVPEGDLFAWDLDSTYVRRAPYFDDMPPEPPPLTDIQNARVLAVLGDSVTTDHISPAGEIPVDSPAGRYLIEHGVAPADFNIYGTRRGNHEVMVRGTFASIRLRNLLVPSTEGGWTVHLPDGERLTIYDASLKYQAERIRLKASPTAWRRANRSRCVRGGMTGQSGSSPRSPELKRPMRWRTTGTVASCHMCYGS